MQEHAHREGDQSEASDFVNGGRHHRTAQQICRPRYKIFHLKHLHRRGVSASMVSVLGVGQKDLAVPTKHGKRLRANRRVVLTIVQKKI